MPVGKVGKDGKPQAPTPHRPDRTFGELLRWHLFEKGTRPEDAPDGKGRRWDLKRFAGAIQRTDRAVRNWLRDKNLPSDISDVARALFGDNPDHSRARAELERTFVATRSGTKSNVRRHNSRAKTEFTFIGVPPRVSNFVGRERELSLLNDVLARNGRAAVLQVGRSVVGGLGGIGKTALAVEYAYQFRRSYAGVCWCNAGSRETLVFGLASFALAVGVMSKREAVDQRSSADAAVAWLSRPRRSPWLLVYDNVQTPDDITEFLPPSGARVLITSRFIDWNGWADEVLLDVLSPDNSIEFLQKKAVRRAPEGARILAEALGYLPLALDHAAATCRRSGLSFLEYAERASQLIERAPRGAQYPRSVFATFTLAFRDAFERCPATAHLISFVSHCAPERIPLALVMGAVEDESECIDAIIALAEVSLIKIDERPEEQSGIRVHRLVQSIGRNGKISDQAVENLQLMLSGLYPLDAATNDKVWPLCEVLTPHILFFDELEAKQTKEWPYLLSFVGSYCDARGDFHTAGLLIQKAKAFDDRVEGELRAERAQILSHLGHLLCHQGAYSEARSHFETAVTIWEALYGAEHHAIARHLDNLAGLYGVLGNYEGARALHQRALVIAETNDGKDHPNTGVALANLATSLQRQGQLAQARELLERALAIHERTLGLDSPTTASTANNLSVVLATQGEYRSALELQKRVLNNLELKYGRDHPAMTTIVGNIGELHVNLGDFDEAHAALARALEIAEATFGPEHASTGVALTSFATLMVKRHQLKDARPLHERAVRILEGTLGENHPHHATALSRFAELLIAEGDLARAESTLKRSLTICESALGSDHASTLTVLSNLAMVSYRQGNLAAAIGMQALVIERCERASPHYLLIATHLSNLSTLLRAQGDLQLALQHQERAQAILANAFGSDHPSTAASINNLALLAVDLGDMQRGRDLLERALEIREKVFGTTSMEVASTLKDLAKLNEIDGKLDQARLHLQRSLEVIEAICGAEHEDLLEELERLVDVMQMQEDSQAACTAQRRGLKIAERLFGQEDPYVAKCLRRLAVFLAELGQHAEARISVERALRIDEAAFGQEHLITASSHSSLAIVQAYQNDFSGAELSIRKAVAIQEKVLGSDHPTTLETRTHLETILRRRNASRATPSTGSVA